LTADRVLVNVDHAAHPALVQILRYAGLGDWRGSGLFSKDCIPDRRRSLVFET
jgi:hypothetical protein